MRMAPHLAISIDMLATGIDVPEVPNLVLFKPSHLPLTSTDLHDLEQRLVEAGGLPADIEEARRRVTRRCSTRSGSTRSSGLLRAVDSEAA